MSTSDRPLEYFARAAEMAEYVIKLWIASGEPVDDCPEIWERWCLLCELAGVDPETLAEGVQERLERGGRPLLVCGHPNTPDNIYHPGGSPERIACRECAGASAVESIHGRCNWGHLNCPNTHHGPRWPERKHGDTTNTRATAGLHAGGAAGVVAPTSTTGATRGH